MRAILLAHGLLTDPCYAFEFVIANVVSGMEDRLWGKVDVLAVNLPYVPMLKDEVEQSGIAAAWAGGENGQSLIDQILAAAEGGVLSERGWMYLVVVEDDHPTGICTRSTEEEFLLVIKFWRDRDGVVRSLARQVLSRLSFYECCHVS